MRDSMKKFKPAVSRHLLFGFAGFLWTVAGLILCARGAGWLEPFQAWVAITVELTGLLIGVVGYAFWFHRLVQKNIDRIGLLPERPCAFAFTSWTGYAMIAIMMTMGITLRRSSIPLWYLSIPYSAMGMILLTGSVRFYREFVALRLANRTPKL